MNLTYLNRIYYQYLQYSWQMQKQLKTHYSDAAISTAHRREAIRGKIWHRFSLSLSTSLTKLKPEGPRFSKSPVSGGPRHPHRPRHHTLPAALTWHPRNSYWFPPPAARANLRGHVDVKKLASSRDHLRISFGGRNVRSTRAHVSRNACRDLISYLLFFIFLFRE